jgi:chromosome segregation ATPase
MFGENYFLNIDREDNLKFFIDNLEKILNAESKIKSLCKDINENLKNFNGKTLSLKMQHGNTLSALESEIELKKFNLTKLNDKINKMKCELKNSERMMNEFKNYKDKIINQNNQLEILNDEIEGHEANLELISKINQFFPQEFESLCDNYHNYLVRIDNILNLIFENLGENSSFNADDYEHCSNKVQDTINRISSKLDFLYFG